MSAQNGSSTTARRIRREIHPPGVPHCASAELAIVGGLLMETSLREKFVDRIEPDYIFAPPNKRAFEAIYRLHTSGERISNETLLQAGVPLDLLADASAQAALTVELFERELNLLKRDAARRARLAEIEAEREKIISEPDFLTGEPGGLSARDAVDLVNDTSIVEPAVLVSGMLHKGSALLLGASSKSFKSWSLIDLAISVANGAPWWNLPCAKGRVLFIDFELTAHFWRKRTMEIAQARGLDLNGIRVLNCRGHSSDDALRAVDRESKAQAFDLIAIDPLYSFLAGKDENSAGDVGAVMRRLAMLAESTGAALAISHHFSKGNQSAKEAIDRFSGSGVFARFPDALLTMTKHEEDDAFTIDATVRNFAPMNPFVLRWKHPVMARDGSLDPANVKKPAGTFEAKYNVAQIIEVLGAESLSFGQIVAKAKDDFGMSMATVARLLKIGQEAGTIEKLNLFYRAVSRLSRP